VAFFIPSIYLNLEFLASSVGQIVENTEKQIAEALQNANKANIDVELNVCFRFLLPIPTSNQPYFLLRVEDML
jgi:hypothetical protein